MDPDACLARIRELVKNILSTSLPPLVPEEFNKDAVELADHVEGLDQWMSRGSFLPEDWRKGRPSAG